MIKLTRGLDFTLDSATQELTLGRPTAADLAHIPLRLWLTLTGPLDPQTGMLINVTDINAAFRHALADFPFHPQTPTDILNFSRKITSTHLPDLDFLSARLELHPHLSISLNLEDQNMIELTTQYELAASHRLCNPHWDSQQNLDTFGKCSNPQGHGHNYTLQITLRGIPNPHTGQLTEPQQIDQTVQEFILDRFDHKNLNEDTPEFAELIPTVENMVKVFWELLDGRFPNAQLARVALWETPKTYAEYRGPSNGPLRYSDSV